MLMGNEKEIVYKAKQTQRNEPACQICGVMIGLHIQYENIYCETELYNTRTCSIKDLCDV